MIAAWMAYATLVAALACLAAMTAERALRLGKRPARLVWIGAMTLACLVPLAATRRAPVPATPVAGATSGAVLHATAGEASGSVVVVPRMPTIAVARGSTISQFDRPLLWAWFAASLVWCVVLVVSGVRVVQRRRQWSPSAVDDVRVLISPDVGPAVVGVIRPQIVIPAWVPTLAPEQRALVLAHEQEHARARDPLLLAAGALTLVAMPWNAALWYALSRLRLAVEADCDRRVLQAHPDARAYSSLLIDVIERNLANTLRLAALGASRSELARRLALLTARTPHHLPARILGAALLSLACVIVACETPQPASIARDSVAPAQPRPQVAIRPDSRVASTHDSVADGSAGLASRSSQVKRREALQNRVSSRAETDTLMPMTKQFLEQALFELAARPDSALTREDVRKLAEFVRGRRIVSMVASESPRTVDEPPSVPIAAIRQAVETHYPTALRGGMGGGRHYLWFVGDRTNHVLGSASGPEGLGADEIEIRRFGQPPERPLRGAITWGSVVKMVPGTPPSAQRRGDQLQVATFPSGTDTVVVVWARLWGESSAR